MPSIICLWSASSKTRTINKRTTYLPARCVMGSFKPTFLKRDANSRRGLQASRPPLRCVGSWKQINGVEATHLPFRAGSKRVHTARAGDIEKEILLAAAHRRCGPFFCTVFRLWRSGRKTKNNVNLSSGRFFSIIPWKRRQRAAITLRGLNKP